MYDNMELIVHTEVTHNPHQNNNDTYQTFEQYRYKEVADRLIGCKILTQNEINILNFEKEDRIRSRKSYQEFIKWLKIKQNSSTEEFLRELYNILNRNSHYRYQKTADQAKESLELIIKESAEGKI
jgi:transposase